MASIGVGDRLPAFQATLQDGTAFDTAAEVGGAPLVFFFYPKDHTPICTQEACGFRDAYEQFTAAGARVVGVSSDSPEQHRAFIERHRLPFPIISDRGGALRRLFGVPKTLGFLPGRVTYVVDREGIVRLVFNAQLVADDHVRRALEAVRELAPS